MKEVDEIERRERWDLRICRERCPDEAVDLREVCLQTCSDRASLGYKTRLLEFYRTRLEDNPMWGLLQDSHRTSPSREEPSQTHTSDH